MSRTFIPVPGLEDVIDHSDDRSMLPYEISKALLAACRERPDSAGALLMELYFPAELPHIAFIIIMEGVFLLYDLLLSKLTSWYSVKARARLKRSTY